MTRISDVLRVKGLGVSTIDPDALVRELLLVLAAHNIGAAVVVSGTDVVGIVTERDVVRGLHRVGPALLEQPSSSIMSTEVVTCLPEDDVVPVLRTMTERRFRHMPVLDDGTSGRMAGIVSIGDLVKARIGELEDEQAHLQSYLAAGP
jgi:CBS domain-containing protein